MGSVVLTALSLFLGCFFILVGSLKISPTINKEMHRDIRRSFVQYAKVFPLSRSLGFKIPSKQFRLAVGWTELVCGISLAFVPSGVVKLLSNIVLLIVMVGSSYTHTVIEDKFERTAPSIVFTLMLACRLIVQWQVGRRVAVPHPKHD